MEDRMLGLKVRENSMNARQQPFYSKLTSALEALVLTAVRAQVQEAGGFGVGPAGLTRVCGSTPSKMTSESFIASTQKRVSGQVRLRLFKEKLASHRAERALGLSDSLRSWRLVRHDYRDWLYPEREHRCCEELRPPSPGCTFILPSRKRRLEATYEALGRPVREGDRTARSRSSRPRSGSMAAFGRPTSREASRTRRCLGGWVFFSDESRAIVEGLEESSRGLPSAAQG